MVRAALPYAPTPYREAIERDERPDTTAIGVVVPFDFELDWEYWRYLPSQVSLYFTRTPMVSAPVGMRLAREVSKPAMVMRATRALGAVEPAATLYACSSGSFIGGVEGEETLRRAMVDAGAREAVTTSGAMIDALRACGARRIALATPYTERLTMTLAEFVEDAGFEVVSAHYLGMNGGIPRVSQSTIASLVRQAARPEADAVFVSCTALRTYGMVAALEEELDCPVLTSNQVSLWAGLAAAGALEPALARGDGWVLGGGAPAARSTQMLMEASGAVAKVA